MVLAEFVQTIDLTDSRATFRVFKIERKLTGREDIPFLERVFQKLLLNFTWSVACVSWEVQLITIIYAGGSTERTLGDTMSSREVSLGLTILAFSTVPSHCQREEIYVRRMALLGWHFTV